MTIIASKAQLRASFARWALFLVPLVLLLGFLSGAVSGSGPDNPWFAALEKPAIYPPPQSFAIVWSVLYVLMGLAAALVCAAWGAKGRTPAIIVFVIQLLLNLAWSPLFFMFHELRDALYLLGALDLAALVTLALFWRVRWQAGLLLLPYVAWIGFATFLNWQFLELNPRVEGMRVSGAVQRIELNPRTAPAVLPASPTSDTPASEPAAKPSGKPAVQPEEQFLNPPPGGAT
jgi:benzodiazapine receptor